MQGFQLRRPGQFIEFMYLLPICPMAIGPLCFLLITYLLLTIILYYFITQTYLWTLISSFNQHLSTKSTHYLSKLFPRLNNTAFSLLRKVNYVGQQGNLGNSLLVANQSWAIWKVVYHVILSLLLSRVNTGYFLSNRCIIYSIESKCGCHLVKFLQKQFDVQNE